MGSRSLGLDTKTDLKTGSEDLLTPDEPEDLLKEEHNRPVQADQSQMRRTIEDQKHHDGRIQSEGAESGCFSWFVHK